MSTDSPSSAVLSKAPKAYSALVVEPTLADAMAIIEALSAHLFDVTVADTFGLAKVRMGERPPDVLLTEVRLREYNGLHLVLRGKSLRPDMAALVVSGAPDVVLQAEAEAMEATFLVKPLDSRELAAAVFRTIAWQARAHPAEPIRPPFERRKSDRRQTATVIRLERRTMDRRQDLPSMVRAIGEYSDPSASTPKPPSPTRR